ncbi:unnamed protein product [Adineta ricciae]|uniref:Uncharacterized protein n=1 Tax=Adineta ricciae TaxID=249248 RepID=A0A815WCQ7_ADIRI|nr:unnamed protein product [Adineta ricciae]
MFTRFQKNYSAACKLRITSGICFSPKLAEDVDYLASFYQMHNEAMVIALLNVAAVMCDNSRIFRANKFAIPMNLYNLVVARSSYGKSPILDIVRKCVDEVVKVRPSKFKSCAKDEKDSDRVVYFDENTAAGLLGSLRGCTRFLITDEADVVLKKMGYTLLPPNSRDYPTNDCRSQLLTLYDRPHNFVKRLKLETVQVFDAKLNVLGAVSGDLMISALSRQASGSMADALLERTILWPLDGDVIPTFSCTSTIDNKKLMSIEQFAVIMSFIENIHLYFATDANEQMILWCDHLKETSATFKDNDHLAARFGKSVQNAHRIVGFMYIIELAYAIGAEYLTIFEEFPIDGETSTEFVERIKEFSLKHLLDQHDQEIKHFITTDMVERCRDLITGNIEQYRLLMYLAPEERASEIKPTSTTLPFVPNERNMNATKKEKRIFKLQPRLPEIKSCVLLFKSLIFTSSTLYTSRIIKRSATILSLALTELVQSELLQVVKKGFYSSKWTPIYIKRMPSTCSTADEMKFEEKLAAIGVEGLNLENLRDNSRDLVIDAKGVISLDVIRWLQQPEYDELNLDLDILMTRYRKPQAGEDEIPLSDASSTTDVSCDSNFISKAENDFTENICQNSSSRSMDDDNNITHDVVSKKLWPTDFPTIERQTLDLNLIQESYENSESNRIYACDGVDRQTAVASINDIDPVFVCDGNEIIGMEIFNESQNDDEYSQETVTESIEHVQILNENERKSTSNKSDGLFMILSVTIELLLNSETNWGQTMLLGKNIINENLFRTRDFIHIVPFTNICPLCKLRVPVKNSHSRQVKVICEAGEVLYGTVFWLECRHFGNEKEAQMYSIFPNFIRVGEEHIYSVVSLSHGIFIYMGGCHAIARNVINAYSSNVVNNANSWWNTADSLNLEAFSEGRKQVQKLCWKRLAQALFMYKVIQFHLMMGCLTVKLPMALRDFDKWSWEAYPKMLSWFIYLWSSHKEIIGPCGEKCSVAIIIDGHQKCRRRVCRYKDVEVRTEEFDKLVIGCCRTPLPNSCYCVLHQNCQLSKEMHNSVLSERILRYRKKKTIFRGRRERRQQEGFGATGCRTNKARSDAYIRRCSRSFGLIACVTNCRVFVSFGEIFRSETLREILHLLFSTIRVAGKLPPAGCYDDGCHLIKYLHNHIGNDLKATDAAMSLSTIKFSVDRTHFKNHIGHWCRRNMNPNNNKLLDNVNTEAAEQSFSWLKRYSCIISALGWLRAPVFLLLLFHMKNLARCNVRSNRIFNIVEQCQVIADVSLHHSKTITDVVPALSTRNVNSPSSVKEKKQASVAKTTICPLNLTKTDWIAQVALIRKNHNMVDRRRIKTLKRL